MSKVPSARLPGHQGRPSTEAEFSWGWVGMASTPPLCLRWRPLLFLYPPSLTAPHRKQASRSSWTKEGGKPPSPAPRNMERKIYSDTALDTLAPLTS